MVLTVVSAPISPKPVYEDEILSAAACVPFNECIGLWVLK